MTKTGMIDIMMEFFEKANETGYKETLRKHASDCLHAQLKAGMLGPRMELEHFDCTDNGFEEEPFIKATKKIIKDGIKKMSKES